MFCPKSHIKSAGKPRIESTSPEWRWPKLGIFSFGEILKFGYIVIQNETNFFCNFLQTGKSEEKVISARLPHGVSEIKYVPWDFHSR